MAAADPLFFRDPSLPVMVEDYAPSAAWAAHLAAGRIGSPAPPPPPGRDYRCAGLAAALGWRSAAGRFTTLPDAAPAGDAPSSGAPAATPRAPDPAATDS